MLHRPELTSIFFFFASEIQSHSEALAKAIVHMWDEFSVIKWDRYSVN
jgi:hypothetical protein